MWSCRSSRCRPFALPRQDNGLSREGPLATKPPVSGPNPAAGGGESDNIPSHSQPNGNLGTCRMGRAAVDVGIGPSFRPHLTRFREDYAAALHQPQGNDPMTMQIRLTLFAVCAAALVLALATIGVPEAEAKAQIRECHVGRPTSAQGHWTWRNVDGRKCWYAGRTMIPRSQLQWPKVAQAKVEVAPPPPITVVEKRTEPMDAQARMLESDFSDNSFEARWRARVSIR